MMERYLVCCFSRAVCRSFLTGSMEKYSVIMSNISLWYGYRSFSLCSSPIFKEVRLASKPLSSNRLRNTVAVTVNFIQTPGFSSRSLSFKCIYKPVRYLPQSYRLLTQNFEFPRSAAILMRFQCLNQYKRYYSYRNGGDDDRDFKNDPEMQNLLQEIKGDFKQAPKTTHSGAYSDTDTSDRSSEDSGSDTDTENMVMSKERKETLLNNTSQSYIAERKHSTVEIEDVEEFDDKEDAKSAWTPPLDLRRGSTGVFDIDELHTLLEKENARDICVIKIPREVRFVEHMFIVSALSHRHMRSVAANLKWIYKRKKSQHDPVIKIEGLHTDSWYAVDLGNIILHIFMPETRMLYDLETLWTVGEKFDDLCQRVSDPYTLSEADLFWMDLGLDQTPK